MSYRPRTKLKLSKKLNFQHDLDEIFKPVKRLNFEHEIQFEEGDERGWSAKDSDRFRKKFEENRKLAGKFTPEFKFVMSNVRKQLNLSDKELLSDTSDNVRRIISNSKRIKAEDTPLFQITDPIDMSEYLKEDENCANDSTTWILLGAKCDDEHFRISPPDYHISRLNEDAHWLERPKIEWKVLNESFTKCRFWLEKIPENLE